MGGLGANLAGRLPTLPVGEHEVVTPVLPPKSTAVYLVIKVDDAGIGEESIRVCGMLPENAKSRALPQVNAALANKLPKLKSKPER